MNAVPTQADFAATARQIEKNAADDHASRVLAKVKRDAAALRLVMNARRTEGPSEPYGSLYDDHDIASIRASSWDGSL